jgi:ComF family protein
MDECDRQDGFLDKTVGDQLMVLFGAPRAHEDDPVRAVRAALNMQTAMDELAPVMARLMFVCWQRLMAFETLDGVVPVPLHAVRLRERGFNQAELIAAPFAELFRKPMVTDAVVRVRPTESQTRLSREERLENVKGAFEPLVGAGDALRDKTIALIDDVCTTGATGNACAAALKQAGAARVILFTFARASLSDRP